MRQGGESCQSVRIRKHGVLAIPLVITAARLQRVRKVDPGDSAESPVGMCMTC